MSLVNSVLNPLRTDYQGRFDKYEQRASRYGGWEMFVRQNNMPDSIWNDDALNKIKASFGASSIQLPVIDGEDVAIGNIRSCTVADSENTSQLVTLTFVTYAWGFTMTPAQHAQNSIGYDQDFSKKMKKYLVKLQSVLDASAVAQLETDKNQFYTADMTNIYPVVADAMRVPQAEKNDLYNQASVIMEIMDFFGPEYGVIASTNHKALVKRYSSQGEGNSSNEAFQFDPYVFGYTNRITNGAGVESTAYVVNESSLAVQNRNDVDSIMGNSTGSGYAWEEVDLPMIIGPDGSPLKVGSLYYDTCSNAIADLGFANGGHSEASKKELYMFSTDMVFATAYNSDRVNTHSAIQKFEVLN